MAPKNDLKSLAANFAAKMQDLLVKTVCDWAQVNVVASRSNEAVIVGTGLNKHLETQPARMRTPARTPIWIDISCRLILDGDERSFLTVQSSYCGILLGQEAEVPLLHYDYERDKEHYTEAHVQVYGKHEMFERYMDELGDRRTLDKIHLPVGGRRFRPSVEDVLEALIVERLVRPKDGWANVLDENRKVFRKSQIAALVRKDHITAIRELERLGYTVIEPDDASARALIAKLIAPKQRVPKDEEPPRLTARRRRR